MNDLEFCKQVRLRAGATDSSAAIVQRLIKATDRLERAAVEIKDRNLVRDRPLADDLNVLIARCKDHEELSEAEQRELWEWLEERDGIIGDMDEQIEELRAKLSTKET